MATNSVSDAVDRTGVSHNPADKIDAMTAPPLTRLLPAPAAGTSVRDAYAATRTPRPDRPWIGLCMVASLDGSIAVDGASGKLGNANDLDVLLTLRSMADMILVGAGTVRGEGYMLAPE